MEQAAILGGLFVTAFLAATLVPAQSEILLAVLERGGHHDRWALLAVATAGNVLGSVVNWLMGRYLAHLRHRRWFPVKPQWIDRASAWYRRWGAWSLLLSWAPVVGDPLTLVAGLLRVDFRLFLLLVTIAKLGRYWLVVTVV